VLNESRHILEIDVDPKMGRRGLGPRLMTQSIEDARAAGARHRVAMRLLL